MKTIPLALILLILLAGTVSALSIEKGTILNPSTINMSAIIGTNTTLDSTLVVHPIGWTMDSINYSFEVPVAPFINMSSFNYTSISTHIQVLGNNATVNFTITNLPSDTAVVYGDDLIEWDTDGVFAVNLLDTSTLLRIDSNPYLYLQFLSSVEGIVMDQNKSRTFNNTEYVTALSDLTEGYVKVMFNADVMADNVTLTNWTQYYEFDNDLETEIEEDLYLITDADSLMYFQVLDTGNSPIKDAVIRVYHAYPVVAWTDYTLMGQRLSSDQGYTFFYFDTGTQVLVTVQKDGYELSSLLVTPADETRNSEDTALIVYLNPDVTATVDHVSYYIPRTYNADTTTIPVNLFSPVAETVTVTTSYYSTSTTLTEDSFNRFSTTLTNNVHFNVTTQADLTVNIYVDGTLWKSHVVEWDGEDKTEIFDMPSGFDTTRLLPVFFIIVILAGSVMSVVFQGSGVGVHTFMIGTIILSFISTDFIFLSFASLLYYLLRLIYMIVEK